MKDGSSNSQWYDYNKDKRIIIKKLQGTLAKVNFYNYNNWSIFVKEWFCCHSSFFCYCNTWHFIMQADGETNLHYLMKINVNFIISTIPDQYCMSNCNEKRRWWFDLVYRPRVHLHCLLYKLTGTGSCTIVNH